jgi:hypothetical protein
LQVLTVFPYYAQHISHESTRGLGPLNKNQQVLLAKVCKISQKVRKWKEIELHIKGKVLISVLKFFELTHKIRPCFKSAEIAFGDIYD